MSKVVLTPDAALDELAWRKLARESLVEYGQYVYDWWIPSKVHELICEALEEVYWYIATDGREGVGALIIEIPPQHGKSTIVSRLFPSWVMGKNPNVRTMLATYAADFSADHSKEVREIISGARFKALFGDKANTMEPVELSGDSFAKGNWSLAAPNRGGMVAIGVGGGATGRPADLIIIDDPFKNREEAESASERAKRKKWMTSSILSRRTKRTAIVMIHTRWHREDLIGEMIKASATDDKAIKFKVLSLPVVPLEIDEYATSREEQGKAALQGLYRPLSDPLGRLPGSFEPLWPEEFGVDLLEQTKATLEANGQLGDWFSLYMQQPRPSDGVFFSDRMFTVIDAKEVPEGLTWCGYMDLALGETERADWCACARVAYDDKNNFYIRDMVHIQDLDEFLEAIKMVMLLPSERWTVWGVEAVAFQKLVFKNFIKDPDLKGRAIEAISVEKSKVVRARPVRTSGLAKKIFLVRGQWIQSFLLEALDFPTGSHDDQVDTVSGGMEMSEEQLVLTGQLVF